MVMFQIGELTMERFIACAKLKCLKFKLSYKMSMAEAIKAHPRRGTILVENKGKMGILKVRGKCWTGDFGLTLTGRGRVFPMLNP